MIKCQINIAGEASRKVIGEPHRGVGGEEARKGREDTKPDKEMGRKGRKGNRGSGGSSAERVPRSGYQHRLRGGHAWTLTGGGKVWALPQRNMYKRDCASRVCPSTQAPDLHRSKQHRLCSADGVPAASTRSPPSAPSALRGLPDTGVGRRRWRQHPLGWAPTLSYKSGTLSSHPDSPL